MNVAKKRRRRQRREDARRAKRLKNKGTILQFEDNFSPGVLLECARQCRRSVSWKGSVQRWMLLGWRNCVELSRQILDGSYAKTAPKQFVLRERGKSRLISPVTFRDRVVERALCERVLLPLLGPTLCLDNAASQRGKGTEFARDRLTRALSREARIRPGSVVVVYDYHDYFGSIPSRRVMDAIAYRLRDLAETPEERDSAERTIRLTETFVCEADGLGLGNQTSQVAAIWWASPVDHWLSEVARVPNGRYMDDGWAIFPDRASALSGLDGIRRISEGLGLELNEVKTRVMPIGEGIPYLKTLVSVTPTGATDRRLVSAALRRWRSHARAVARLRDAGVIDDEALSMTLESRCSVAKRCDSETKRRLLKDLDAFAARLMGRQ